MAMTAAQLEAMRQADIEKEKKLRAAGLQAQQNDATQYELQQQKKKADAANAANAAYANNQAAKASAADEAGTRAHIKQLNKDNRAAARQAFYDKAKEHLKKNTTQMGNDFYSAMNKFGSNMGVSAANKLAQDNAASKAAHLRQQASLRNRSAANYDMAAQAASQKANVDENTKAGQIAASKAQALNEQSIQNLGAGAGAGAAALSRQTVSPDIEAQQKIKNDQAALVSQYQNNAMDERQMQQNEYSDASDVVNKAQQVTLNNNLKASLADGEGAAGADTTNITDTTNTTNTTDTKVDTTSSDTNTANDTPAQVAQANISAAAVQNAININAGYTSSMRVNAWDSPSLSLDSLQKSNPQLYAVSNKLAEQYKNNPQALANIRITNVKTLQKAAGLPETGNLEAGQGKIFANALGNSATEINTQTNDVTYTQSPTGEYIPQ